MVNSLIDPVNPLHASFMPLKYDIDTFTIKTEL